MRYNLNMKNNLRYKIIIFSPIAFMAIFFTTPLAVYAQTVSLSSLSAQGASIYGWKNGVPTALYTKKETQLFPIASITKLVTAKAVEQLYPENTTFTISTDAMTDTLENNQGIVPGMVLSRDDLLRALLISSSNGAAKQFAASVAPYVFLNAMNTFLHTNAYTKTSFTNPTGLDPYSKSIVPNSLTTKSISYLISSIYTTDPLLTSILEEKSATITDQKSGTVLQLKSSDELNYDPLYNADIILGKTGTTDLAGQNLAFITNGQGTYDYITVVFLHSKNRYTDGKLILDWLAQVLQYKKA
jgi:D-alanyl-D-alanine carboxypeptidase